jgi:FkbM family methyltransferase
VEMSYDQIPKEELDLFASLKDIKVVFDVGSRDDVDYVTLKPDIELHAFEPNPEFFVLLEKELKDRPDTYLNNFGLGDRDKKVVYNTNSQGFVDGEGNFLPSGAELPIKTLDGYVAEKGVQHIDFLKIDTEGYDFNVLLGGLKTIPKCRYIQYEHWSDIRRFHILLGRDFKMEYIGNRNVFCTRLW